MPYAQGFPKKDFGDRVKALVYDTQMKLRPYQKKLIKSLRKAFFEKHRSVCLQLPTGAGKTIIAAFIAQQRAEEKKGKTLILTHRGEILHQFYETLALVGLQQKVGIIASKHPPNPHALFQIATIQTLARRKLPEARFVIIDEAHHVRAKTWERIVQHYKEHKSHILGLTATPARLDGRGLGKIFSYLVCGPSLHDLVKHKYLAPAQAIHIEDAIDVSDIKRSMGDYAKRELASKATKKLSKMQAEHICKHARARKTIFFGVTREHAEMVDAYLRKMGLRSAYIDGDTEDKKRQKILQRFATGNIQCLCNVELFTEGLDAPACDTVAMGRPTMSLTLYLQMIGRALRPAQDKKAIILDMAGNTERHGLHDEPHEWSLTDGIKYPHQPNRDRVQACKRCGHLWRPKSKKALRAQVLREHKIQNPREPEGISQIYAAMEKKKRTCPNCSFFHAGVVTSAKTVPNLSPPMRSALAVAEKIYEESLKNDPQNIAQAYEKVNGYLQNFTKQSEYKKGFAFYAMENFARQKGIID